MLLGGTIITKKYSNVEKPRTGYYQPFNKPKSINDVWLNNTKINGKYIAQQINQGNFDIIKQADKQTLQIIIKQIYLNLNINGVDSWYNYIIQHRKSSDYNIFKFSGYSKQFINDNFDIFYNQLFNLKSNKYIKYIIDAIMHFPTHTPYFEFIKQLSKRDGEKFAKKYNNIIDGSDNMTKYISDVIAGSVMDENTILFDAFNFYIGIISYYMTICDKQKAKTLILDEIEEKKQLWGSDVNPDKLMKIVKILEGTSAYDIMLEIEKQLLPNLFNDDIISAEKIHDLFT